MRFVFNFTSKYKHLISCTDFHLKMSSRYLWIYSVAGMLLLVAYSDAALTPGRNVRNTIAPREGKISELPLAFRAKVADALTARKRDPSFLLSAEEPPVAPILGGYGAPEHKYPWFAHVLYVFLGDPNFYILCGGSVYNKRTVITAAHCIEDDPEQEYGLYAIAAGVPDLSDISQLGQIVFADDVRVHKRFRGSGAYNAIDDIGLLILDTPLNFTSVAVKPVPSFSNRRKDKMSIRSDNCVAIGFGAFVQHPDFQWPNILQELSPLNFETNRDCHRALWKNEYSINPNQVCSIEQNSGGCFGDSGSPVGCYDSNGVYYQVGIVNWGPGFNGRCGDVTVSTRISKYRRWLEHYSYRV